MSRWLDLDHDVAQPRARRDLDLLEVELAGLLGLGGHLLVAGQTRPALGLPRLGAGPDPGQLVGEPLAELGVLAALDGDALGLLLQVGRVVALVGVRPAAVELEDPLRHVVEEVPVVGHGQDGALVGGEVALEPLHALGVEVVGRLVEQEQVGLAQQELAQRDPAPLTTGEVRDRRSRPAGSAGHPSPAASWESRSHASALSRSSWSLPISSMSSSE